MERSLNVLDQPLVPCSHDPVTGWFRDGCCNTDPTDTGSHTVCCEVTEDFLLFLRSKGNNLMTPAPQHGFPGLQPGNRWCVCAGSWLDAYKNGRACPVVLESTHKLALDIMPLEYLMEFAIAAEA